MAGVAGDLQVPLFAAGRQARARPGPLGQVDDQRRLDDAAQAQPLGHQVETAARGGHQGPAAGVPGAKGHVHGADLVLGLLDHHPVRARLPGQVDEHPGGRGHGVGGNKGAAAGQGAERHALAAVEQQAVRPGRAQGKRQAAVVLGPGLPAESGRGQVLIERLALAEHALQGRCQHRQRPAEQPHQETADNAAGVERAADLGTQCAQGQGHQFGHIGKKGRVADQQGALPAAAAQPGQGVGIEEHAHIDAVGRRPHRRGGDTHRGAVAAAADARHEFVRHQHVQPGRLRGPRQHRADGLQALAGLAAKHQGVFRCLWGMGHAHLRGVGCGESVTRWGTRAAGCGKGAPTGWLSCLGKGVRGIIPGSTRRPQCCWR